MIFDSCVLIDALNGHPAAMRLIREDRSRVISVVSRSEVLAGARTDASETEARELLGRFIEIPISASIADLAGLLRRERKSRKLPDAFILATVRLGSLTLITRDNDLAEDAGVGRAYQIG